MTADSCFSMRCNILCSTADSRLLEIQFDEIGEGKYYF